MFKRESKSQSRNDTRNNHSLFSSRKLHLLVRLKDQLIVFFDELIEQFPLEPDLVIARIFLKDKIPTADIMNYIRYKLVPLKETINNRDDSFFLKNNILFEELDNKKVNHFKKMWESTNLGKENKETIWKWFDSFIILAERYDKIERKSSVKK